MRKGNSVRICANCGKEYDESLKACVWCGFPSEKNVLPGGIFSEKLSGRCSLIRIGRGEVLVLWDGQAQKKIACRRIPAGPDGDRLMKILDQIKAMKDPDPYPELLDVVRPGGGEGYYLTEFVDGIFLASMTERENPPDMAVTERLTAELMELSDSLDKSPHHHGSLSLENLVETWDGKVRPVSYGTREAEASEDRTQILRLILRLISGEWQMLSDEKDGEEVILKAKEKRIAIEKMAFSEDNEKDKELPVKEGFLKRLKHLFGL